MCLLKRKSNMDCSVWQIINTRGIFIAVLEMTVGIFGAVCSALTIAYVPVVTEEDDDDSILFFDFGGNAEDARIKGGYMLFSILCVFSMVFLFLSCLQIIFSSLLVTSISKKSKSLMAVWIAFKKLSMMALLMMYIPSFFIVPFDMVLYYTFLIGINGAALLCICELKNDASTEVC